MLSHRVDDAFTVDLGASGLEGLDEVAMTKAGFGLHRSQLSFRGRARFARDEFYCGLLRRCARNFGDKHGAVIGAAKKLAKGELAVDLTAFPGFPSLGFTHLLLTDDSTFYAIET